MRVLLLWKKLDHRGGFGQSWFVEKWVSEGWHFFYLFFFVFFSFRLLLVKFNLCSCSVLGLSFLVDEVDYVDVAMPFYMIVQ